MSSSNISRRDFMWRTSMQQGRQRSIAGATHRYVQRSEFDLIYQPANGERTTNEMMSFRDICSF